MARGPKTSKFRGVRKRGCSFITEMRFGALTWNVSKYDSEDHAGVAHDLLRVLDKSYKQKAMNFNFWDSRVVLEAFVREHNMERFRVLPTDVGRRWDCDKQGEFIDLVGKAHDLIFPQVTASVEAGLEGTGAARTQELAADIVPGSSDDLRHSKRIRGKDLHMGVEEVFSSDSSGRPYFTRESEKNIPPLAEGLSSAVAGSSRLLELQSSDPQAQVGDLLAQVGALQAQVGDQHIRIGHLEAQVGALRAPVDTLRIEDLIQLAVHLLASNNPSATSDHPRNLVACGSPPLVGPSQLGQGLPPDPAQANGNLEMRMNRSTMLSSEPCSGGPPAMSNPPQRGLGPPSSPWDYGVSPMQQQHPNQGPWMMQQQGMQPLPQFRGDPPGSQPPSMTPSDDFGNPFWDYDLRSNSDGFDI